MDAFEEWWAGYAGNIIPEHRDGVKLACRFAWGAAVDTERERCAANLIQHSKELNKDFARALEWAAAVILEGPV